MTKDELLSYVHDLIKLNPSSASSLSQIKKDLAKKYKGDVPSGPTLMKIMKQAKLEPSISLSRLLRKRAVRTMSGIAPVAVLTQSYPCPGRCAYCPKEKNVPRSYLSNEPAVMRAIHCEYHPYEQVTYRLRALEANGHQPTKIELIVIGGTWSYLPKKYQYWFIAECFRAANDFQKTRSKEQGSIIFRPMDQSKPITDFKKSLLREQNRNEKTVYQIIGLTLETRPDFINNSELGQMRALGATRVEIGVQALDDKILKYNHRDSTIADITKATRDLKNWGFKVTYHFMPALPGSNPAKDLEMFQDMFTPIESIKVEKYKSRKITNLKNLLAANIVNNNFNPDQLKFYPTVVTKGSLLYKWWKAGKYQPYSDEELQKLIADCKAIVPSYVRIIRLIRDIPGESIEAGNKITNLRQIMQARGIECRCIRCREAKVKPRKKPFLYIQKYQASDAAEYFLSFEAEQQKCLFGFLRLRLNNVKGPFNEPTALVRELHVYGELVPIDGTARIQHTGLGKALLGHAESIAKQAGYHKIAIISGVGVRPYYRKLGYKLVNSYLVKNL